MTVKKLKFILISLMIILGLSHCQSTKVNSSQQKEELTEINRPGIVRTIASHRHYLSQCYGKALTEKGQENLKGTLMIEFKIGPDGRAIEPQVVTEKSNLSNSTLTECLFAGITSWGFPTHPKGEEVAVRYPFGFRANPPKSMQHKLDSFQKLRSSRDTP